MNLNWSALIVPSFVLFAGLEWLIARKRKLDVFSFDESVTNISIGITERLLSIFITLSFYEIVGYIYEHYRLLEIPTGVVTWISLLLATDLIWYWYHRLGHEVNVLWAAHIVHHQSEDFNYTVSARITLFQGLIRNCFWCILPLIGFAPYMVTSILVVHGTYSFFTHTQVVRKLGWLEYIFITPSHHRVHHASNEKYLNKNYGDIFIFWDKLFGTFERESEKPAFGLTHPIKSQSFLWAHFHYYLELIVAATQKKTVVDKLRVWFNRPETVDPSIRLRLEKIFLRKTYEPGTVVFNRYVVAQLLVTVTIVFVTILFSNILSVFSLWCIVAFVILSLINCCAILEQRHYIFYLEYIRLWIVLGTAAVFLQDVSIIVVGALFTIITLSSPTVKENYFRLIYSKVQRR